MTDDTTDFSARSRHISAWIQAPATAVYAVASDPAQLSRWAAGLSDAALADADVEFAALNELGVLDHVVRLATGEAFYNPMRVIPSGADDTSCEVVFTLRRQAGVTDEQFEDDAAAVAADLQTLRELVERRA